MRGIGRCRGPVRTLPGSCPRLPLFPVAPRPMSSDLTIAPIQTEADWEEARTIRKVVFIDEQDCPPELEWDGHDEASRHLLGRVNGTPVATARWRTVSHGEQLVAKLERFAVLRKYRGSGYGSRLVRFAIEDARRAGFNTFLVHAQAHLEDWYEALGFVSTGRHFEEAGIPHVEMIRRDEP